MFRCWHKFASGDAALIVSPNSIVDNVIIIFQTIIIYKFIYVKMY